MLHVLPGQRSPLQAMVEWFNRLRAADPLDGLDPAETARIASDLAISADDLVALAGQSDGESELMTRMMAAHGLNRAQIEAEHPEIIRAMAVTCAHCRCKDECQHDLSAGSAKENASRYCPNTDTIGALGGG